MVFRFNGHLFLIICKFHFIFLGIVAQQVQLNGNITEEIGSNSTMLTCNFTLGEGEVLKAVLILATNVTVHDFTSVASFDDDFGSKLQPFGKVLFGNVSLTPFNRHLKNVSMSFDDLNCKHSRLYICQIVVKTETDITGTIKKSDPTGISVKGKCKLFRLYTLTTKVSQRFV